MMSKIHLPKHFQHHHNHQHAPPQTSAQQQQQSSHLTSSASTGSIHHNASDCIYLHQLTEAERRGGELVNAVRRNKAQLLKRAKVEATSECDKYKSECDKRMQELQHTVDHALEDHEHLNESKLSERIETMRGEYDQHKQQVIEAILTQVATAQPVLAPNLLLQLQHQNNKQCKFEYT